MASQAQPNKVLRIGVIQDGKIVQESLVKAGESVKVGDAADNTFVFPKTALPSSFMLFERVDDSYVLGFTAEMKGRISSGGAVVALDKLRSDPSVEKAGDVWRVPLTQQDRGKVSVDNVTVLFQFVAPPPEQAVKPLAAMDFRPRLMEDEDPVLMGFLALFTGLAAVLLIWVWNAPPPPEITIDEIPDRFAQVLEPPEVQDTPEVEVETQIEDPNQRQKAEPEPDSEPVPQPSTEPRSDVDRARAAQQAAAEVGERSLMIKMLTTAGENGSGSAQDLWGSDDGTLDDLDAALAEVGGVEVATSAPEGQRGGSGTGNEDVDIGDLAGVKGGSAQVDEGPAVQVQSDVALGAGELDGAVGDQELVRQVVQSNLGQLTYCHEQQLRSDPTLAGRVVIEWNVSNRRVTSAAVFANTTGNAALGECILSKVRRWRFDPSIEGEILFPFVFSPKG